MHVYVLGPIEITRGGHEVRLAGQHQRALIARLASEAGKVVSADQLIDTLWGEQPPATARTKLQGYVSAVRKSISGCGPFGSGPFTAGFWRGTSSRWPLITRPPGYLLSTEGVAVDLLEYRALLTLAGQELEAGQVAEASGHLREALGLWRGAAFADVEAAAVAGVAAALEQGRLLAIERKAECDLQLGRYDSVAQDLSLVLTAHPLREATRAALMLALYRRGCRAEALESYRAGRRLLREQLGIEPGHVLRWLHELMLSDDPQLTTPDLLTCGRG